MTLVSRKLYIRLLLEMARIIRKNTTARRESEPAHFRREIVRGRH